ncbi:sushi, von Willebrand factor type A, EGF and pentraxin domain-containing protein 1-like [Asterias rubens]|uniref:sushi, von Willebrand factor type A, EGF and pentraxin domain-containing protein 1-like n=1 Tax=Asterias rubens TaxID=7604 RepID=UPI0014559662|nr:sushi, von Willebrand factor type A, EGF and pentraxin domain-containing protein 1-like [Asterias rubens]
MRINAMALINHLTICFIVLPLVVFLPVESVRQVQSRRVCLLEVLENGYYVGSLGEEVVRHVKAGTAVEARCNAGYFLRGDTHRTCVYRTRRFREDAPSCQDVNECEYMYIHPVTVEYSDSWTESISGASLSEATWDFDIPVIQCHDMAHCKNTPGSYECECDRGYEGDGVNSCEQIIEKQCEQLEPPQHGSMTGSLKFVQFECEKGYRISGARSRRCVNGVWNGLHPICEVIGCGQPRVPTNGYIEGSTFDVGNWVKFRCNKGYELAGTEKLYCRPGDGYTYKDYWSGAQPSCRRYEKNPESIAGKIKTDFIDHLEVFTVSGRGRLAASGNVGLELVLAFDKSSSLNHVNFERGINFTISLVRQFGVSNKTGGTRVAAISFATTAVTEFTYGSDTDTLEEVIKHIKVLKGNRGGGTALGDAFLKVFELVPDMRNGSKKALFILTDGVVTIGDDPSALAQSLRIDKGFEIFVVAIGEGIDQRQLRKIASQPYSTHIFLLNNFEDLASLTEIISEKGQEYRRCGQAGNLEIPQLSADRDKDSNANPNAWPWLAQIIQLDDSGPILKCGGAVLCEEWIVTAGSCVFDFDTHTIAPEKLRVRLGAYELGVKTETQRDFDVKEVFLFDNYDPYNLFGDIAVLKLNQTVNLTSSIRTLCLPLGRERLWPKSNSLCYIAGWGIIDPLKDQPRNDSMPSIYPKQLEIQLVNDDVCKRTMAQLHPFDKRKMCAGYKLYTEDESCQGDTGSPLVCKQIDGSWGMAGIVSYSKECMEYNKYSVFTRVGEYSTWIHELTGNCTSNYLADLTVGGFT